MPVIIKYIKGFLDNLLYICFTLFLICIFFCKKRYNGNKAGSGLSQYDFNIFFTEFVSTLIQHFRHPQNI